MEVQENRLRTFVPNTQGIENGLPIEIILEVLKYCGTRELVQLTQVCKAWNTVPSNDHYWKHLVLSFPGVPASLKPTTPWKEVFDAHQLAYNNLCEGKWGATTEKQTNVSQIFTYESKEGESTHVLLLLDRKKVVSWNLEHNTMRELLTKDHPLQLTQIVWRTGELEGAKGPRLCAVSAVHNEWFDLDLFDPINNKEGAEASWVPEQLSNQYRLAAVETHPHVWTAPTPVDLTRPTSFLAGDGHSYFLKLSDKSLQTVPSRGSPLLNSLQNPSRPLVIWSQYWDTSYLVLADYGSKTIWIWNTKSWTKKNAPMKWTRPVEMHHLSQGRRELLLVHSFSFAAGHLSLYELDRSEESLTPLRSVEKAAPGLTLSCLKSGPLGRPILFGTERIIYEWGTPPRRGRISLWKIEKDRSGSNCSNTPQLGPNKIWTGVEEGLDGIGVATKSDGLPLLLHLSNEGGLELRNLTQKTPAFQRILNSTLKATNTIVPLIPASISLTIVPTFIIAIGIFVWRKPSQGVPALVGYGAFVGASQILPKDRRTGGIVQRGLALLAGVATFYAAQRIWGTLPPINLSHWRKSG